MQLAVGLSTKSASQRSTAAAEAQQAALIELPQKIGSLRIVTAFGKSPQKLLGFSPVTRSVMV